MKTAFLNGTIKEEAYITISDGFKESHFEGKVAKLKRALYGLRQAPHAWYNWINSYLTKNLSLKKVTSDSNLYFSIDSEQYTTILLYVDDLIATGDNHEQINHRATAQGVWNHKPRQSSSPPRSWTDIHQQRDLRSLGRLPDEDAEQIWDGYMQRTKNTNEP